MAKAKPIEPSDEKAALLAALLSRAGSATKPRGVDITPGAYQLDYTLHIAGDIVVGEPVWAKNDGFSDGDMIAALLAGMDADERDRAVRNAVKRIAKSKKTKTTARELKDVRAAAKQVATDQAEKSGLALLKERAGSIKGEPIVEVNDGEIAYDAEANAA
tara:strand:+ start:891 stop:1370 length:480 start_codon:yes stop_codon:yes gene_type:complete